MLAAKFLGPDPIQTRIGSEELCANKDVKQIVHICNDTEKAKKYVCGHRSWRVPWAPRSPRL